MKFTSAIAALITVSLVAASDPRILARTDDVTAGKSNSPSLPDMTSMTNKVTPVEEREPQGLIGFQCHPWYST
jgi:hypothetical protein